MIKSNFQLIIYDEYAFYINICLQLLTNKKNSSKEKISITW